MPKFKVTIKRVEYYSMSVVVDARSAKEAKEKTEKEYLEDDYLWEKLTDMTDDSTTDFVCTGEATEEETLRFINI